MCDPSRLGSLFYTFCKDLVETPQLQPIGVDSSETEISIVFAEEQVQLTLSQFVFCDTHGRLAPALMSRLLLSGVGVATLPSWPPPGPALPSATQELEKMAACSKVSERGRERGATPTTVIAATVERAAARLVHQVRLTIAFFPPVIVAAVAGAQRRSDR